MTNCAASTRRRIGTAAASLLLFLPALAARQVDVQLRRADPREKPSAAVLRVLPVDRLILRVFNDGPGGGLLFRNSQFSPRAALLESYLADLPVGGRPELWAWMAGRRFDWMAAADLFDREWADGALRPVAKLDLFNPRAVQVLLQSFRDLAATGVAGILIQDDFHIRYNEGFSPGGLAAFRAATGREPDPSRLLAGGGSDALNWQRVKINCLNRVLGKIVAACRDVNPKVGIGLNVFYETALSVAQGEAWYAHNLRELAACGIDRVYLMAYHRQMRRELGLGEEETRDRFRRAVGNALRDLGPRLVVKLQARDWDSKEPLTAGELRAYIGLLPRGVERVCFSSVEYGDLPTLRAALSPAR